MARNAAILEKASTLLSCKDTELRHAFIEVTLSLYKEFEYRKKALAVGIHLVHSSDRGDKPNKVKARSPK